MKEFFKVLTIKKALELQNEFSLLETEQIKITDAYNRIIACDIISDINIPDFIRSTMDGYAVRSKSVFGASESNPAILSVKGSIEMGKPPDFEINIGESAKIATGAMLPKGADSVVMVEHTDIIDNSEIQVYKSLVPFQHVVNIGEDFKKEEKIISKGQKLRPQEIGILACLGYKNVLVYKKPEISIISTGDELVSIDKNPGYGKIRDINTYTLSSLIIKNGGIPNPIGIVKDDYKSLCIAFEKAVEQSDMIIVSGGSSVGTRDFTIDILESLPDTKILLHGISIKPGKPTILAKSKQKAFWGMPGHVTSAMIVFHSIVKHFIHHISGFTFFNDNNIQIPAILSRNIASVQGRTDFVRVKLIRENNTYTAQPVIGKSGLLNTMIKSDGYFEIDINLEGKYKGELIWVTPFN